MTCLKFQAEDPAPANTQKFMSHHLLYFPELSKRHVHSGFSMVKHLSKASSPVTVVSLRANSLLVHVLFLRNVSHISFHAESKPIKKVKTASKRSQNEPLV